MSIWDSIKSWWRKPAQHYVMAAIPFERVDQPYEDGPIDANAAYLRVWVVEMFLARSRDWFKDWQPAVHGLVKLRFADREVEIARVAAPSKQSYAEGKAVLHNYALLDLAPFRGGTVEIEAGLVAMQGKDHLATAIDVVAGFANLVTTPLSAALSVARVVKGSADKLFGQSGDVHLAYHDTFSDGAGGNQLRAGYVAIVLATKQQLDTGKLSVKEHRLHLGDGPGAAPLTGFDYMLLRFERASTRNDIEHFSDLEPLRQHAIDAALAGDAAQLKAADAAFVSRVLKHPELIDADRRRIIVKLRKDLEEYRGLDGAVPRSTAGWRDFAASLPPASDPRPVTFAEFFPDET